MTAFAPDSVLPAIARASDTESWLVPAFNAQDRRYYRLLCVLWLVSLFAWWAWWFRPEHNISTFWYAVNTAVLLYETLIPNYFIFIFGRGRVPDPGLRVSEGVSVAMVVTKAPSEPFDVVEKTLTAMLAQDYPHDTWLADEAPTPEMEAWCRLHGVKISTRMGIAEYHRPVWPRRTRCKEGNLAYFYDRYGYEAYDIVVQLDADHVPAPGYLKEMLRPFADPAVGYVSAPSICDANTATSWSARGRLYAEASLHGALQVGYTGGLAPLCIGSHYAVRTNALKEIGGLGPELAEDHSTTLMMNAHGWRGVHAVNAIAHGDGPVSFPDLVTQEYQWSRSLTMIMLRYSRTYLPSLPWGMKAQFLFCQLWYPLFSVMMLSLYLLPIAALVGDHPMVNVTYPEFILRFSIPSLVLTCMAVWWHRRGWSRPADARLVSWEAVVFLFSRWPWCLWGVLAGIYACVTGSEREFRVTPKGTGVRPPLPIRVLLPYMVLSAVSSLCVFFVNAPHAAGFYIFASMNAVTYAGILVLILVMHDREAKQDSRCRSRGKPLQFGGVVATGLVAVAAVTERVPTGLGVLMIGVDDLVTYVTLAVPSVIRGAVGF